MRVKCTIPSLIFLFVECNNSRIGMQKEIIKNQKLVQIGAFETAPTFKHETVDAPKQYDESEEIPMDSDDFDDLSKEYILRDEIAEDKFVDELARVIVFMVKSIN